MVLATISKVWPPAVAFSQAKGKVGWEEQNPELPNHVNLQNKEIRVISNSEVEKKMEKFMAAQTLETKEFCSNRGLLK